MQARNITLNTIFMLKVFTNGRGRKWVTFIRTSAERYDTIRARNLGDGQEYIVSADAPVKPRRWGRNRVVGRQQWERRREFTRWAHKKSPRVESYSW